MRENMGIQSFFDVDIIFITKLHCIIASSDDFSTNVLGRF
jgi:hypothetical protein